MIQLAMMLRRAPVERHTLRQLPHTLRQLLQLRNVALWRLDRVLKVDDVVRQGVMR